MVAGSRRWRAPGGGGAARGTGDMLPFSSSAGAAGWSGCEEVVDAWVRVKMGGFTFQRVRSPSLTTTAATIFLESWDTTRSL